MTTAALQTSAVDILVARSRLKGGSKSFLLQNPPNATNEAFIREGGKPI